MPARTLTALLVVVAAMTALAGCGGSAADAIGTTPESARLAPADAVAFISIATDEGSEQWQRAEALLERFPGARDALTEAVREELENDGLTWDADVAPALGPEVVIVVTADQKPVVLTQPESDEKLDALLSTSDEPVTRADVGDWTALAQGQADLTAYRTALDRGTLDKDEQFVEAMEGLPEDALVRAWADLSTLTRGLEEAIEESGTSFDLGLDSLSAALSAEEDGMLMSLGYRAPGGSGTQYDPELFAQVPGDAVAAVSFGGTQGLVDRIQGSVDLDEISAQVEETIGVSIDGVVEAFSGEGVLYVRKGEGGSIPEITLVLDPPDQDEAWATVDRIARRLAEQADSAVTTVTEGGVEVSRFEVEGFSLSYAAPDDETVIVTTGAEGIRTFGASGAKLVDADGFTRAADSVELGERTSGFAYLDVDGLIPLIEDIADEDPVPSEARDVLEQLDSFILQAEGDGETTRVKGFVRVNER